MPRKAQPKDTQVSPTTETIAVEAAVEEKVTEPKAPVKKTTARKTAAKKKTEETPAVETAAVETTEVTEEKKPVKKTTTRKTTAAKKPATAKKAEEAPAAEAAAVETAETVEEKKPAKKPAARKTATAKKPAAPKKTAAKKAVKAAEETAAEAPVAEAPVVETPVAEAPVAEAPVVETPVVEAPAAEEPVVEAPVAEEPVWQAPSTPRRSIAFIGSECHPFVKTGGLGDVMYALPRVLAKENCDVRVILPRYECIPQEYQNKMVYRGEFYMDLGETGRNYYVGIMEYVCDGVVYDFIDNQDFFSGAKPYTNLVDDIPKYCYFDKAALSALLYMNWIPDVIHCHDWQAGLVPIFLRTLFAETPLAHAKTVMTIHNLRFQGVYNIPTLKYWTGLPDYAFTVDALMQNYVDANMFKGGLAYADRITTVSGTYSYEIQTPEYGDGLDAHLRHHSGKLSGIVNGIDYEMWNTATDASLAAHYDAGSVLSVKPENKRALQAELGLDQDDGKFVIGLISRLTDQKGLDLVNAVIPAVMDGNTQVIILGTGDKYYEDSFRYYENKYKGSFSACIQYDEARAHRIYAGADALLVPSRFEPCGLTQLNAMHYGTVPIVRETGGLKDTVAPYNYVENSGNGFTFDRYDSGLLLDAINRAKTVFFTERGRWNDMVLRDMYKDVSWENSARQYKNLYLELTPW